MQLSVYNHIINMRGHVNARAYSEKSLRHLDQVTRSKKRQVPKCGIPQHDLVQEACVPSLLLLNPAHNDKNHSAHHPERISLTDVDIDSWKSHTPCWTASLCMKMQHCWNSL